MLGESQWKYIREDKGLCWVKPNGDDVLGIAAAIALYFLDCPLFGEEVLLIVCQHDDELQFGLVNIPRAETVPGY